MPSKKPDPISLLQSHEKLCAERYASIQRQFTVSHWLLGALAVAFGIGFLWLVDRMDSNFEKLDEKMDERMRELHILVLTHEHKGHRVRPVHYSELVPELNDTEETTEPVYTVGEPE